MRASARLLAIAVGVALALAGPAAAQVEEEDLESTELAAPTPAAVEAGPSELAPLVSQGEALLRGGDALAAAPVFGRVVDVLEAHRLSSGSLSPELRRLLVAALTGRAATAWMRGDRPGAEGDLGRRLAVDAATPLDPEAYPDLLPVFEALRKRSVGEVALTVDPIDAEVLLDGIPVDWPPAGAPATPAPTLPALAGGRTLEARRPGYAPETVGVDVAAGRTKPVDLTLERTGPVIRLQTRPEAAEVLLDGNPVGTTRGTAPLATMATTTTDPRSLFSAELVIAEVGLGLHVLEVRKPGFRPYRVEIEVAAPVDYQMPPIVLEEEHGRIVLLDVPPGASVSVDGAAAALEAAARPQLTVRPGEHRLTVTQGTTRMFSTSVRVADRQDVEVRVRLRPGLAFLGVLGGDAATAAELDGQLRRALGKGRWALLDGSEAGLAALRGAGATADALRRAGQGHVGEIAWKTVRTAVEARLGGLVYAVAVPSSDLLASHVDLWVWAAAPGPARADLLRFAAGDPKELERVASAFEQDLRLAAPSLGALVVDSAAAPLPIVADVTPGGPAAAAGLAVGDMVVAAGGVPIFDRAGLDERIAATEIGEPLELGVQGVGGARAVRVTVGASPKLLSRDDGDLLPPVAWAELAQLAERSSTDRWVVEVDQALVLLRQGDWEEAARRLRAVRAPQAPDGVGQAAVDYWLGVALSAGGTAYRDAAVQAFQRAAAVEGGRLLHADGAWVAPRARARLAALGSP